MRYWIGTDEAGYGPTLGPLLISATLWSDTADIKDSDTADCVNAADDSPITSDTSVTVDEISAKFTDKIPNKISSKTCRKGRSRSKADGYCHNLFNWNQSNESSESIKCSESVTLEVEVPSVENSTEKSSAHSQDSLHLPLHSSSTPRSSAKTFEDFSALLDRSMTRFASALSATLPRTTATQLVAADSKKLYTPARGIAPLEQHLFGFFELAGWSITTTFRQLLQRAAEGDTLWQTVPWYQAFDTPLPQYILPNHEKITEETRRKWAEVGISLQNFASRFLDADAFNRQLATHESKADLLSTATLGLVKRHLCDILATREDFETFTESSLPSSEPSPSSSELSSSELLSSERRQQVIVLCDKHGGRNTYAPILTRLFCQTDASCQTDAHFQTPSPSSSKTRSANEQTNEKQTELRFFTPPQIVRESREESVYDMESSQFRIRWYFTAKGEKRVPVALASMLSKYLREIAMTAFNAFWQQAWQTTFTETSESSKLKSVQSELAVHAESGTLRPTAGYPEDAVRFLAEIEPLRQQLGIPLSTLRRNK